MQCNNCKTPINNVIYDWLQKLPWCRSCWMEYLRDTRNAQE
jgi:hypothetical protein